MNKEKKLLMTLIALAFITIFLLGVHIGIQKQTDNIKTIAEKIQIEEMNIDLNETKITQALIQYFDKKETTLLKE